MSESTRMFPMQGGPDIPWWLAEVIYAGYSTAHGTGQSLERLAERGGFGWSEVPIFWSGIGPGIRLGQAPREAMDEAFNAAMDRLGAEVAHAPR